MMKFALALLPLFSGLSYADDKIADKHQMVRVQDKNMAMAIEEARSTLEFREAEKRLTLTEQSTLAEIAAWGEDAGYRSAARKALLASNGAFRKYRANQCEYEWSLAAGGNGATDMRLSCEIELTQSRIKLLEGSAAGLQKR